MTNQVIPEAAAVTVKYSWGTYCETATKIWLVMNDATK